jgi:hypothetical protein
MQRSEDPIIKNYGTNPSLESESRKQKLGKWRAGLSIGIFPNEATSKNGKQKAESRKFGTGLRITKRTHSLGAPVQDFGFQIFQKLRNEANELSCAKRYRQQMEGRNNQR